MLVPKFTEKRRRELLKLGARSLFYFGSRILGFDAFDPILKRSTLAPLHEEICAFLEGRPPFTPWRKGMVVEFRGAGKSIWTTKVYPLWRGLYIVNFSTKIISNSSTNAQKNHFLAIYNLLTIDPRADFLHWLYSHRVPEGLAGTNSEQIILNRTEAAAEAAISYWGVDSAKRGSHSDLLVCDDPEGFDVEGSTSDFRSARMLWNNTAPLLKYPARSQVLLVCTPSPDGSPCMAYHVRDSEAGDLDNSERAVKILWRELLDEEGRSRWPDRFPERAIKNLKAEESYATQYALRRTPADNTLFEMKEIADNSYRKQSILSEGRVTQLFLYPKREYDPDAPLSETGYVAGDLIQAETRLDGLRFLVSFDPLHKTAESRRARSTRRPAKAAIVVTGVSDDGHIFVIETWTEAGIGLNAQAEKVFYFYCKYCPHYVTFEGIGAQIWFVPFVRQRETFDPRWGRPRSLPGVLPPQDLPMMSGRLLEVDNNNERKEDLWRGKLAPYLREVLHLGGWQEALLAQMRSALEETSEVDLVDALAQGAGRVLTPRLDGTKRADYGRPIWSRPLPREIRAIEESRNAWRRQEATTTPARFSRPWAAPLRSR